MSLCTNGRSPTPYLRGWSGLGWLILGALLGCNTSDMHDQPRYDALEASRLFDDGRASRPLVEGTVARGQLRVDHHYYEGRVDGELVSQFPMSVDEQRIHRGRVQFGIFCTPCHGAVGHGDGMAVQRGFPRPPSFHSDRLRDQPVGHLYDVITNGYGRMMDYKEQILPDDRWAIVAYIRALQLSQQVDRSQLSAEDLELLDNPNTEEAPKSAEPVDESHSANAKRDVQN